MLTKPSSLATGYAAAWSIVFVWSFWLVVSRIANDSGLTVYDLAAEEAVVTELDDGRFETTITIASSSVVGFSPSQ